MAIKAKYKDTEFSVGDSVKVIQKIKEGDKERLQTFSGIVIKIKGEGENRSFTVRRIGNQGIGIERIFPLLTPSLESIEVVRKGGRGIRRSKLYYIRDKSKREIEKIYFRNKSKESSEEVSGEDKRNKSIVKSSKKQIRKTDKK